MKLFKPITDINNLIQKSIESTRESIDNFLGKGFKGGIKAIFDFSAEGLIEKADFELGVGILHLTMDGDREAVDTAVRFRQELAARLHELDEMACLVKQFKAEDIKSVKQAARDMQAFLDRGKSDVDLPVGP